MGFDIRLYYTIRYSRLLYPLNYCILKKNVKTHPLCNPIQIFHNIVIMLSELGLKRET